MKLTKEEMLDELDRTECVCGGWKPSGKPLCGGCYAKLPTEMKRALYRRPGAGLEQAFYRASEFLAGVLTVGVSELRPAAQMRPIESVRVGDIAGRDILEDHVTAAGLIVFDPGKGDQVAVLKHRTGKPGIYLREIVNGWKEGRDG